MMTRMEKYAQYRKEIAQFVKLSNEINSYQKQIDRYQKIINRINPNILANVEIKTIDLFKNPIDLNKAKQLIPTKIYENIKLIDKYKLETIEKEKNDFFAFLENNPLFEQNNANFSQKFLNEQPLYKELKKLQNEKDNFEINYKNKDVKKDLDEKFHKSIAKNEFNFSKMEIIKLNNKKQKFKYFFLTIVISLITIFLLLFTLIILYLLHIL